MMRLLSEDDYEYLAVQPGFTAEIAKRLRAERRRIVCAYLRNLVADFEKLYGAGQVIVTYAAADQSELAAALFRQRIHFYGALVAVYCRLMLHRAGLSKIEVAQLIQS